MAQSKVERVGKALDLLNLGLQPYVGREMKAVCGLRWLDAARESVREDRADAGAFHRDTQAILAVMWNQWNTVFKNERGELPHPSLQDARF